jgi:hypothetical protein
MSDSLCLDAIARILNVPGQFTPDTLDAIITVVMASGREFDGNAMSAEDQNRSSLQAIVNETIEERP